MAEGRGSSLVHLLVVVLSLVAFGFAIAAERRRSVCNIRTIVPGMIYSSQLVDFQRAPKIYFSSLGKMIKIEGTNETYCSYSSDVATGYGVGAFLFLLSGESLLMGVTRCMCFGRPLTPGGNRAWSIIYFLSSWVTFLIAETCLIAGATKNAYHTQYRKMIYAHNFSCEALRKGVFVAGAVFIVATMILNVYYYMYFTKATTTPVSHKANRVSSNVGMAGYA